ncbi:MAG: TonB-dependent receptor [Ignavibacteria bacterium]|nr:TonB-dependent receptor [Ignavibacteria bacterium]
MKSKAILIIMLLIAFSFFRDSYSQSQPQSISIGTGTGLIKGRLTKPPDNSPLEGVILILSSAVTQNQYGAETGRNGEYVIENIQPGKYNLKAEYAGFKSTGKKNITVSAGDTLTIDLILDDESYTTEEIDIVGERFRQAQNDMRTSVLNLSPKTTRVIPGVGEDVLRSLQTLPGVSAPNDFSSQLIVRGSGPDQNLIIMDNIEIFNPYRLYGVFSMFNPETLEDINLITGGFPSKYGDRLSAVLDVSNSEGSKQKYFTGQTNINISNANIVFSGKLPFGKIPGSWIFSTRRSYYDLILGPFAKKSGLIDESASFPSFEDIQGKVTLGPFKNHKFILNGIYSKDGVNIIPGESKELEDSISVRDQSSNDVLGFAWHYAPNTKFLTKTTFSWYRNKGDAQFGGELLDPVLDREIYTPEVRDSLRALGLFLGIGFKSQYTFRKYAIQNNTIFLSKNHKTEIGGGIDILKTDLSFTLELDDRLQAIVQNNPNFSAISSGTLDGKNYYRANLYAQDRIKISDKLYTQAGLRFDYFAINKKAYLSPRFNLSYAIDKVTTIRAGTGVYYQSPGYEKLIDAQVFYDLSEEKAGRLEAERSIHYVLGLERWFSSGIFARFETYYKQFSNLIVQERLTGYRYEFYPYDPNNTDPTYLRNPDNWYRSSEKLPYDSLTATPVNGAKGKAYGFEIFLEKKAINPNTKLSGWVSYSLSFANRNRDGINTPFRYDQRHSLNVVANYKLLSWLELGARFNYSSNFPVTLPLGIRPRIMGDSLAVLPILNIVQFDFDFGDKTNRFASNKLVYHRLDIRATAYTKFWGVNWGFYLDVINVYNRQNVIGYDFYIDENLKVKTKTIGQFPILPTLGITARF